MATFDQLAPEQRAILELVLKRGQTYDDLADMLGMTQSRVRQLARDALGHLAPASARRVDSDWRGQLADYILLQQSGPEATATRGHLKRSEAARAWTFSLLDSLDDLYEEGQQPEIPEGEAVSPAALLEPRPRRPARERPPRRPAPPEARPAGPLTDEALAVVRRRRLLAGIGALAALAVAIIAVVLITGGDDEGDRPAATTAAAGERGQPRVERQILMEAQRGERGEGIAVVAVQDGRRNLVVQASGLRPTNQRARQAYEVWLFNTPRDAVSLGAQVTDAQGNLQGAAPLPRNADRYRFVDLSRERIDEQAAHSGKSVLRGLLEGTPVQQGADGDGAPGAGQAAPGGTGGQAPPAGSTTGP